MNDFEESEILLNISENLKNLREYYGMSQNELAKRIGLNRSQVNRYESCLTLSSIITLRVIARIFNVSIDYIISYNGDK